MITAPNRLIDLMAMAEKFGGRVMDVFIRGWESMDKDQRDQLKRWTRLYIVMLDSEEERMRRKFAALTSYQRGKVERDHYGPITSKTRKANRP